MSDQELPQNVIKFPFKKKGPEEPPETKGVIYIGISPDDEIGVVTSFDIYDTLKYLNEAYAKAVSTLHSG